MTCKQVDFTNPIDFLNYFLGWNNKLSGFVLEA